jgi:hypothetical protein
VNVGEGAHSPIRCNSRDAGSNLVSGMVPLSS